MQLHNVVDDSTSLYPYVPYFVQKTFGTPLEHLWNTFGLEKVGLLVTSRSAANYAQAAWQLLTAYLDEQVSASGYTLANRGSACHTQHADKGCQHINEGSSTPAHTAMQLLNRLLQHARHLQSSSISSSCWTLTKPQLQSKDPWMTLLR